MFVYCNVSSMSQASILKTFLNFEVGVGGELCYFHLMERYNRVQYFLFYCVVFERGTKHSLFLEFVLSACTQ